MQDRDSGGESGEVRDGSRESDEVDGTESVPTAGAAEDIQKPSEEQSARLRRLADSLFFRAFTQDREKRS